MNHADLYAAALTLSPALLAAGFFAFRPSITKGAAKVVLPLFLLLALPFVAAFITSLQVLGDLMSATDSAARRWIVAVALIVQVVTGTTGFFVQAVGDEAASRKVSWRAERVAAPAIEKPEADVEKPRQQSGRRRTRRRRK